MCGFAGLIPRDAVTPVEAIDPVVAEMIAAIHHRGPDDFGIWSQSRPAVALGFQRLAIVDLSAAGHQPMCSSSGRFVLCFNGEIYNHHALRRKLQSGGHRFRGHSDTEVLLEAIERFGLTASLSQCAGMFAFALWDRVEQRLTLCRDRFGEKPLYYGRIGGDFVFASELHAVCRHPRFPNEICLDAATGFLRHGYVPAPASIYRDIFKLPPGTFLSIQAGGAATAALPEPTPYWSVEEHFQATPSRVGASDEQLTDEMEQQLLEVVREQCLADVPLGAFLSGGLDSSTIVSLMTRVCPSRVRTFTIGFHEAGFDEAQHAREVAAHLGTDHTELYVTAQDALAVIPELPRIYDEPFADGSQVPTRLLCEMARRHVTVCLSGDGGDELLNGYERYLAVNRIWGAVASLPHWSRRIAAQLLLAANGRAPRERGLRRKLAWATRMLDANNRSTAYRRAVSCNLEPADFVVGGSDAAHAFPNADWLAQTPFLRWMQATDLVTYLPDDILVKVDRAAMSVSLETRAPFLDHRFAEFAATLPLHALRRGGQGKWLLRQVLYRYVPRELVERPKRGFAVPLGIWLRGPLREWAEELLSEDRLNGTGLLATHSIRQVWSEHASGRHDHAARLWPVLMLQAWIEHRSHTDKAIRAKAA